MNSNRDILIRARARIADPANFCQGTYVSEGGTKFCAAGALKAEGISPYATHGIQFDPTFELLALAAVEQGALPMSHLFGAVHPVVHVNDGLGHAAVLKMFDRAIELATE